MKLIILFIASYSCVVLAQESDCLKTNKIENLDKKIEDKPIGAEYIQHLARQIFNDETKIYDFIGIDCVKSSKNEKGLWICQIRQSATKFEDGRYTVNPLGVGVWMLYINFIDNTYLLN